jgi:hypothetical protein
MHSERGAITIHVAIALMALLCFVGIVLDQGAYYTARRQAQNAADAGALSGADELLINPSGNADATFAAKALANQNRIWGQAAGDANINVAVPQPCPDGSPSGCISVWVMRGLPDHNGGAHTNTFPTFMMGMVGLSNQGTRAYAKAQVAGANAVECIRPWVVSDKWTDTVASTGTDPSGWDQMDSFDPGDTYTPGVSGFKATGLGNDYGLQLVLKQGTVGSWSAGWTMEIDLGATGAAPYEEEIKRCPDWVPTVGLYKPGTACTVKTDENPPAGCLGVRTGMSQGPTTQGVGDLIALDNTASWNTTTNTVQNTCMTAGTCHNYDGDPVSLSPRIVPLAIFDPASYIAGGYTGTNGVAKVMNMLGFFVEGMCDVVYPSAATRPVYCGTPAEAGKMVVGRLMNYPGQGSGLAGSATSATFIKVTRLVQ